MMNNFVQFAIFEIVISGNIYLIVKTLFLGVTEIVFIIIQQLSSQKYAIALPYVFCIINSIL